MSPTAIVTGGSSGIGAATAVLLAERGFDIGLTFRAGEARARRVAQEVATLGRRVHIAQLDLADPRSAPGTIERLVAALGGLDVLVNNAGINRRSRLLDESVEGWSTTLAVNLVGPWACARTAAQQMIDADAGGRIVNVSSVLAFSPLDGGGAYCAAKSALEMLTKVMALEWSEHGVLVNAVAPGHAATPMNVDESELEGSAIERPVVPLGRAATAREIAEAIAYLATPGASYSTGSSILVDGGLLLHSGPEALQRAIGLPPAPGSGAGE